MSGVWDLVHVITKLELGGAQLATLCEIEHSQWAAGGRFLLHGPGGMLDPEARELQGVTAVEVPALARAVSPERDVRAVTQLAVQLRRLRTPGHRLLVHTHSSKAGILGRWAARAANADLVVHSIHGFGHGRSGTSRALRNVLLAAEHIAAHLTDGFTADSAVNIEQAQQEGIVGEVPARVVRCGIDVAAFSSPGRERRAVRRELGASGDVVLGAFCLKPQKDPLAFARVAAEVVRRRPGTSFWLAGDGELRPALEAEVARLGVEEHVRLLGWRHDVVDLLHASDILLHTSLWEGLPQVFPQAMAAGRAIVATNVDGAPEAISHGETGFLCAPGDVAAMARAVCELLGDPGRRETMGGNARGAVAPFSQECMVADLDRFYHDLETTPRAGRARHLAGQVRYWASKG